MMTRLGLLVKGDTMVDSKRLMEIRDDLAGAPAFFERLRGLVHGDDELAKDLAAAPEFFDEMLQIVEELARYRGLDAFKNEIRATIPEVYTWARPRASIWHGLWEDIVNVTR